MRDAATKGRLRNQQITHCPKGHAYAGENLVITTLRRRCRDCDRQRAREQQRKYRSDPVKNAEICARKNRAARERYQTDSAYRQAVLDKGRKRSVKIEIKENEMNIEMKPEQKT
jgi:hypothetical protein